MFDHVSYHKQAVVDMIERLLYSNGDILFPFFPPFLRVKRHRCRMSPLGRLIVFANSACEAKDLIERKLEGT